MTRDDIIRMARETKLFDLVDVDCKEVRDFVALVAAAEREACAKVCADIGKEYNNEINKKLGLGYELQEVSFDCEAAIRARGQ